MSKYCDCGKCVICMVADNTECKICHNSLNDCRCKKDVDYTEGVKDGN